MEPNPSLRAGIHLGLGEKYLREAEVLLEKGDYIHASEMAWAAASLVVKALAAVHGRVLVDTSELHKFVAELGDGEARVLWASALALHHNLYETKLPPEMVREYLYNVKRLVEKFKTMISGAIVRGDWQGLVE